MLGMDDSHRRRVNGRGSAAPGGPFAGGGVGQNDCRAETLLLANTARAANTTVAKRCVSVVHAPPSKRRTTHDENERCFVGQAPEKDAWHVRCDL